MTIEEDKRYRIKVAVKTTYLESQSEPLQQQYAFAYAITISNQGTQAATLLRRHWFITDANDKVQEVEGDGVVGENPTIQPGDSYEYTSGALIPTEIGHMQGSYQMMSSDGQLFDAEIPAFTLAKPHALH